MTAQPIRLVRSTERVRVYRASAERLLASLADGSVDLLLTDPPYTSIDRHGGSGHLRDWFGGGLSWPQIGRVLARARRKLKASGVAMVMTNWAGLDGAIAAVKAAGFTEVRNVTWDRRWPGLGGGLRHQTEFILVGRTSGSRSLSGTDLVSVAAVGPGTADHYPTQKPVELGRVLAAMAGIGRGSLVVDPFAGSGALLVGSAERGASVIAGDVAARAVKLAAACLAPGPGQPTRPGPARRGPTSKPTSPSTRPGPARRGPTSKPTRPSTRPGPARRGPTSKPTRRPIGSSPAGLAMSRPSRGPSPARRGPPRPPAQPGRSAGPARPAKAQPRAKSRRGRQP
jgi:site-specific DNA-methyltransferase (adenine-specific)